VWHAGLWIQINVIFNSSFAGNDLVSEWQEHVGSSGAGFERTGNQDGNHMGDRGHDRAAVRLH
jgi:hypothetical protein